MKISRKAIVVAVIISAFALPVVFSIANSRAAFVNPLLIADTRLSKQVLTPEMFADAIFLNEYQSNPIGRLISRILERRIEILSVDLSRSDVYVYPRYEMRIYTFFNIPIRTYWHSAFGGEPTLGWVPPMKEF